MERLCAMKLHLRLKSIASPGKRIGPLDQQTSALPLSYRLLGFLSEFLTQYHKVQGNIIFVLINTYLIILFHTSFSAMFPRCHMKLPTICRHKCRIYFSSFTDNRDTPYMVFEYMLHGDLAELLRKADPSIRGTKPPVPLKKVLYALSAMVPVDYLQGWVKPCGVKILYFLKYRILAPQGLSQPCLVDRSVTLYEQILLHYKKNLFGS